ncbi:MAG: tetratricopeptide repeat protein [Alphaproteobacteria bacterium]|nr:tetratricopeptide repeat protein [Alphaproteobacteria bacterium]
MSLVDSAIAGGRCALAVSGSLLRDEMVMLALKEREALRPMTLVGVAFGPVVEPSDAAVARAIGQKHGVLVIVEPTDQDQSGLQRLAGLIGSAPHKPTVVVVAKKINLFALNMVFRGLKIEHVKERGAAFLQALPMPPAEAEVPDVDVPKAKDRRRAAEPDAPRFVFVGREEELPALQGMLAEGGPIVVSGPRGIGRTALVEQAIATTELVRLPDLTLGRGVGADAFLARLAEITRLGGSDALATVLKGEHTPIQAVQAAIQALTDAADTAGQVMVVHQLQVAVGRTGDLFRKSTLELLVEALLTHTYPLKLVFTSLVQPVFFREGRAAGLRRLELSGIKGRFYHDVFDAFHAPEFPRDKFGPISEKIHGNPLAVRTFAVAVRHDPALVDDDRFFKLDDAADATGITKQIEKRVQRLDDGMRRTLGILAHLRYAADGQTLAEMEVNRRTRSQLIAEGLLDMIGTEEGTKRYKVHKLVEQAMSPRETADFRVLEDLGALLRRKANSAEGVEKLALLQEANRCAMLARRFSDIVDVGYPDQDAAVESTYGLLRAKNNARPDLAAQRIGHILQVDPHNADGHLLRLELLRRTDAKGESWKEAIDAAIAQAPVPEVFHEAASHHIARQARGAAVKVLEQAVAALPEQSRLRCRLASLLTRQGRRPEAIEQLRTAMELDPMLPDAYGLLGTLRREEGAEALDEAETLLREAVRLAPGDVVQTSRLVSLLLDIHKGVPERREAVGAEITALLDEMLQADKNSWEAHLTYAVALREMGGDLSRAAWFLGKAKKLAPGRRSLPARFDLEGALLDLAGGKVDQAESRLRKLGRQDPSNHRVFAGLAAVAEARGQHVAAHAELTRAAERTSPHSLDRQAYGLDLARLQALIEANALAMAGMPAPVAPAPVVAPTEAVADAAEPAAEEPVAEEPVEAAPEASDDAQADDGAQADDEAMDDGRHHDDLDDFGSGEPDADDEAPVAEAAPADDAAEASLPVAGDDDAEQPPSAE